MSSDTVPAVGARGSDNPRRRNRLSPRKLLLSKWTAAVPREREKHFLVVRVVEPEAPGAPIELVELEAVHSRRAFLLHWRELTDRAEWRQGWV
jgi:tryptophan-rich hypothetical protein